MSDLTPIFTIYAIETNSFLHYFSLFPFPFLPISLSPILFFFSAVPVKVSLPESAVQVACGDNHTVVLLADGQVFAFGKCQEGQLGHCMRAKDTINWHMAPRPVPGFDESCRATWIGAQGNQTFIAVDEMLVSENSLSQYQVFSNTQMLGECCAHVD